MSPYSIFVKRKEYLEVFIHDIIGMNWFWRLLLTIREGGGLKYSPQLKLNFWCNKLGNFLRATLRRWEKAGSLSLCSNSVTDSDDRYLDIMNVDAL